MTCTSGLFAVVFFVFTVIVSVQSAADDWVSFDQCGLGTCRASSLYKFDGNCYPFIDHCSGAKIEPACLKFEGNATRWRMQRNADPGSNFPGAPPVDKEWSPWYNCGDCSSLSAFPAIKTNCSLATPTTTATGPAGTTDTNSAETTTAAGGSGGSSSTSTSTSIVPTGSGSRASLLHLSVFMSAFFVGMGAICLL